MRDPTRDPRLRLERRGADVRGDRDPRLALVRVRPRLIEPRLTRVHVDGRAADGTAMDRVEEAFRRVEEPARQVEEDARALRGAIGAELLEDAAVERAAVGTAVHVRRREVDRHEVRRAEQIADAGGEVPTELEPDLAGRVPRVVEPDLHAQVLRRPRNLAADVPEPEHAERLAANLVALARRLVPPSTATRGLGLVEPAREGDQVGERELDDAPSVRDGIVEHHHAVGRGGLLVDAVVADAAELDREQIVRCRDHVGADGHLGSLEEHLRAVLEEERAQAILVGRAVVADDVHAAGTQELVENRRGLLHDECPRERPETDPGHLSAT